jgi:hypothetical protein
MSRPGASPPSARVPALTPRFDRDQRQRSAVTTSDSGSERTHCGVHRPLDNSNGSRGCGRLGYASPPPSTFPCPQVFAPPWTAPEHRNDLLRPCSIAPEQLFGHEISNGYAAHSAAVTAVHRLGGSNIAMSITTADFPVTTCAEMLTLPPQAVYYAGSAPSRFPLDLSYSQSALSPDYSICQPHAHSHHGIRRLGEFPQLAESETERHLSRYPSGTDVSRGVVEPDNPLLQADTTSRTSSIIPSETEGRYHSLVISSPRLKVR